MNLINRIVISFLIISYLFSYENKFSYVNVGNGSGKVSLNNFPNLIQREDGYTRIAKIGDGHTTIAGLPEIPSHTTFYQIDPSKKYDFQMNILDSYIVENIQIIPHQGMEKWEVENVSIINHDIYNSYLPFPDNNFHVSENFQGRGIAFVSIEVIPYKYFPKQNKLEVYTSIEIQINEIGDKLDGELIQPKRSHIFDNLYENLIVNFSKSSFPEDYQATSILYIAGDDWLENQYVQDLLEWRHKQGYIVTSVSTSEIGASSGNENTIKSFIENAYVSWENPPEIVGLIGDTNVIDCFYQDWGTGGWNYYNGSTDQDYSQLDGTDLIPEVLIGRISGQGQSVMENVINKTIQYEKALYVDDEWFTRAALVGDPTQSGNSTIFTSQYIENLMINHGMNGVETDYDGLGITNWLIDQFQEGILYYNYRGIYGDSGTSPSNQYNNGYATPFATVMTCGTGDFDQGNSQSEEFVKLGSVNNPEGAVAAIGLATTGTHTAYNNILNMGIYHGIFSQKLWYAGAAEASGDLAMIATYPSNPSNITSAFTAWSNLIGDPALHLWSGVPSNFVVDHIDIISLGTTTTDIIVYDEEGIPVENARVTILMGDDIIFNTGFSNANGEITLNWDAIQSGDMFITVIKRNFRPYEGQIEISSASAGAAMSWVPSLLNVTAGEELDLDVSLINFGNQVGTNIVAELSSSSENITIVENLRYYGNINPDFSISETFPIYIHGTAFDLEEINLKLTILDDYGNKWENSVQVPVSGPKLIMTNNSNEIIPGLESNIILNIENQGEKDLVDFSLDFFPNENLVSIIEGQTQVLNLSVGDNIYLNNFRFSFHENIIHGTIVPLEFIFTSSDGNSRTEIINVTVGSVREVDPLGPDLYGYYIYDSNDIDYALAPEYQWIEIADGNDGTYNGNEIPIYDNGNGNDYAGTYTYGATVLDLPFTFTFYGQDYEQIVVNTNGWISFGDFEMYSFRNYSVPGAGGPSPMVAAFWDDLKTSSTGRVFEYMDEEKVIIQWNDLRTYDGNYRQTFEIILYNKEMFSPSLTGDSEIKIQYQEFNNNSDGYYPNGGTPVHGCYSTVGIENQFGDIGLQYTFNNEYPEAATLIEDGTALFITTGQSPQANLSISNVDLSEGTLDIYISNLDDIAGFQFELFGITVTGASGGLAESNDFFVSTSSTSVLGFSITGTYIPIGSGFLTQVSFIDFEDEICFGTDPVNNVISNVFGNLLQADWGDCFYSNSLVGDLNSDGSLDILDLVILSNLILDNEFSLVGDLNSDGSLDILDIVLLVNVILS